ncbi:translation initiation factor eIF3 core subunit b KNAG_0E00240 [Huiozyma naganishii CBS 8797]|uniref:Eukaryotic translation initiation factor 3 subunit B n=1 Tax=Huiozyma naganishii (strain ATCC MYA-139 / BCRC 22969 / CBS 8797 / KCTC 17520 / NBRC 10181 / NCYC 3082 / Yp74L-3) TaxID=1071383 RepID=J7RYP2_HUIN7|nr:hypothetical protein KNAG_0E00240 [Kazachstania naganishii CBS 8797]CCK70292.1 hypothetical protein KNAG_0E00240 [Kazachstania naganishii CBS 8797]
MTTAVEDIRIEDIPVDDIDFSDLEHEYKVDAEVSFDQYIVVTGAPVIPEAKVPLLKKALGGLFAKAGKVVNMEFPLDSAQKTKGFLFVECATAQDAKKIIKSFHGKRLDLKHRLSIYTLADVERFNDPAFPTEFKEPEFPDFVTSGELKSWLLDENVRDQYVMQDDKETTVVWNTKNVDDEDAVVESRENWSNNYVRFSPKGTYLFSYHVPGVSVWGGAHFNLLKRFFHPNVRTSSVSPCEKYLVTFSPEPLDCASHAKMLQNGEESPFTVKNDGHQLCIWDIESGLLCATFPVVKSEFLHWPLVRWSYNDRYCARMVGDTLVVHDSAKKFAPMDSKNLKIAGVRDFAFAPTGVKLQPFRKTDEPSVVLAYWTPETNNMSCKAAVVEVGRGRVLKTVNLVQVSNVTLHWQNQSDFLCFNVERHTKSKKTYFSNLEICKMNERDIPVEKIELKNRVVEFGWEPQGKRFALIAVDETADLDNVAIPKNIIHFFAPEKKKDSDTAGEGVKRWKLVKELPKRFCNTVSWSPAGRFVVIATLVKPNLKRCEPEFFDLDYAGEKNINDDQDVTASLKDVAEPPCGMMTDICWDPSGRFFVCWSSAMKHKLDNGYKMFNVAGQLLKEEAVSNFRNFMWRPRPESQLSNAERKKVRKNLKEWSAQFEEQDVMEADSATRDMILRQRELLAEWTQYRAEKSEQLQAEFGYSCFDTYKPAGPATEFVSVEEIKEEIIEETKTKVEA